MNSQAHQLLNDKHQYNKMVWQVHHDKRRRYLASKLREEGQQQKVEFSTVSILFLPTG